MSPHVHGYFGDSQEARTSHHTVFGRKQPCFLNEQAPSEKTSQSQESRRPPKSCLHGFACKHWHDQTPALGVWIACCQRILQIAIHEENTSQLVFELGRPNSGTESAVISFERHTHTHTPAHKHTHTHTPSTNQPCRRRWAHLLRCCSARRRRCP